MTDGPTSRPAFPFPLPEPLAALLRGAGDGSGPRLPPLGEMAGALGARLPGSVDLGLGPAMLERLTLLINHVLCSEPEAMARLAPHAGRCLQVVWNDWPGWLPLPAQATWRITPPGLLDLDAADEPAAPAGGDLTVTLETRAVLSWALQAPLATPGTPGSRPPMAIQGDAELATAVAWLAENLRWDLEDDLARVVGDGPAHLIGKLGRGLGDALRGLLAPLRR